MRFSRRHILRTAAGAPALPLLADVARADSYPARPVQLVVGLAPGSTTDIAARLIGHWYQQRLNQPFVVENRPGAGGTLAAEAALRAKSDGYTLLVFGTALAISATLYPRLKYDILRDLAPIAGINDAPNVLVVNPSVAVKSVPELIAAAKADPGALNMGSGGNGTSGHLGGALFMMMTGVKFTHIPYRGSPLALNDLLAGHVQLYFAPMPPAIEFIRAGKLRALGVTSLARSSALPELPAIAEFVPDYQASTWVGVGAPKNTPVEIVARLNAEMNAALADPKIKTALADMGSVALPGSAAEFGKFVAEETEKWGKVVKFADLKPD